MDVPGQQFLSVAKVAIKLDVSVRQVWRLVEWGHLPKPAKVAGETRFLESDIEEYMVRARLGSLPPRPPIEPKKSKRDKAGGESSATSRD